MIIESIHIESFGKLSSLDMTFDPKMNLVFGGNESGKSTLAAFLRFMLYGFQRERRDGISEEMHRMPWDGSDAAGSMVFSAGGKKYRIDRRVTASASGERIESAVTTALETGLPVYPRLSAGQAFLDMPPALFDRTAFIGGLSERFAGDTPLAEAIENLIFSGDEKIDTARSLSELAEAKTSLIHPNGKGGAIANLRQKEEELSKRLAIARAEQKEILKKEATLVETRRKKEEAKKQETACIRLEADYKNAVLIKTYDYMHELEENVAAIDKEIAALRDPASMGGFPPTDETLARLALLKENEARLAGEKRAAKAEFDRLIANDPASREERKRILLMENSGGIESVTEDAKELSLHQSLTLLFAVLSAVLLLASIPLDLFAFGISYAAVTLPMLLTLSVKLLFAVASGVLFTLFAFAKKKLTALYKAYAVSGKKELLRILPTLDEKRVSVTLREESLAAARKRAERAEEGYLDLIESASAFLMMGGVTLSEEAPSETLSAEYARLSEHLSKIRDLEEKKSGVTAVMKELRSQLAGYSEIGIRATVPPGDRERLLELSHRELCDGIEHYRRLYHFYDDKERELVRQTAASRRKVEDPYSLESEMLALQEQLASLFRRHSAYDLAEDAIKNAGERLRTEISPRLTGYACRLMSEATDGKYTDLDVDKNIDISFTENEISRRTAFLSAGTRDIAYFSLKMALVDLLYSESPPLFFDESFAHQDTSRAMGAYRALRALTREEKQVFLFTCHERDRDAVGRVFEHFAAISL